MTSLLRRKSVSLADLAPEHRLKATLSWWHLIPLGVGAIVETGIYSGGSLLFHATLCEALGRGRVIGIDKHIPEDTRVALSAHRLAHRDPGAVFGIGRVNRSIDDVGGD